MGNYSTFLFAQPSFIEGMARVLDFGDTLNVYNTSETAEQADLDALRTDLRAVGLDLNEAARVIGREQQTQTARSR